MHALRRGRLDLPAESLSGVRQIVELLAPAGYGKSTLLDTWMQDLRQSGRRVDRLILSPSHRDPVRFLSNLIEVVAGPKTKARDTRVFSEEAGLAQLIELLTLDDLPRAIVLDDVHLLESSPSIDTLNALCREQPDHVLLIVSAREYTGLTLQKRLLANQLKRFTASDLAFTPDEARTFLERGYGLSLTEDTLAQLYAQTEGWIGALQMAALAMSRHADPAAFVDSFGGSNRGITDYLAEAVLDHLCDEDVEFLFRISVLDRINADICRALTGERSSQLRLESFERQNLFLLPMDDRREWYRFHPLFGEFLSSRFRAVDPDGWVHCLRRAESWSVQHDYQDDAINYALRAGLQERAAQILSVYAEALVQWRGEHRTLMTWIEQLSPSILARHPQIQIGLAWSLTFNHRFEEAAATFDALLAEIDAGDAAEAVTLSASVRQYREVTEIVAHALADRAGEALATSRQWLERNPDAPEFLQAVAKTVLAYALKCVGEFGEALKFAREANRTFAQAGAPYGVAWAEAASIMALMRQGRMQQALAEAESALAACRQTLGVSSHSYCVLSALSSGLYYEFDNLPAARKALAHGLRFLAMFSSLDPILVGYLTHARLLAAEGRYDDAIAVLMEGEQLGVQRGAPRMVVWMVIGRANALLRQGDVAAAEALLQSSPLSIEDGGHAIGFREKRCQLLTRIALARGDAQRALELLQPQIRHARAQGQQLRAVELLLLRARALQLSGNSTDALRAVHEALVMAAPEGMIRVFVDEGDSLHPLLLSLQERETGAAAADVRAAAHLQKILAACRISPELSGSVEKVAAAAVEPLTKRELQLLRMIESGLSNKQLADALFVSEGTIKWHLHNLYGKLSVRSRSGAIAKSRKLALL